jgi:hypothetical protein
VRIRRHSNAYSSRQANKGQGSQQFHDRSPKVFIDI